MSNHPGMNFFHMVKVGVAIAPQSISGATVNGSAIVEPWKFGRQISFLLAGGAFASSSVGACTVQGRARSDGSTWSPLKQSDGTTNLIFTATALADAGALEGGLLLGTLDLGDVNSETYEAIRLSYVESGSAAQLISASYVISGLYTQPSGTSDDLWAKLHNQPAA